MTATETTDLDMDLDALVAKARAELDRIPAALDRDLVIDEGRFWPRQRRRVRWARGLSLGGTAMFTVCLWASTRPVTDAFLSALLLALVLVGVALCGRPGVVAQAVARASWWAIAMLKMTR